MSSPAEEEKCVLGYPSKGQPPAPPVLHSGYAPPYHGYTQPYPGYPNPSYRYPPPAPLYNTAYYMPSQLRYLHPEPKKGYTFAQAVLCLMITLIIGTTAVSLVIWLIFGLEIPMFQVISFSIPTFDISNSSLRATWEANLTIKNPNQKLLVSFDHIESSLAYREVVLDTSLVEPFQLREGDHDTLPTKFEAPNPHRNTTGAFWLKQMGEDRKNGTVVFDLKIVMAAMFSSGEAWKRQTTLRVVCEYLKVQFSDSLGGGTWMGNEQDCVVYY